MSVVTKVDPWEPVPCFPSPSDPPSCFKNFRRRSQAHHHDKKSHQTSLRGPISACIHRDGVVLRGAVSSIRCSNKIIHCIRCTILHHLIFTTPGTHDANFTTLQRHPSRNNHMSSQDSTSKYNESIWIEARETSIGVSSRIVSFGMVLVWEIHAILCWQGIWMCCI